MTICNTGIRDTLQYTIDSVAGGYVVADTASGLLGAGECRNVQLTFDRTGLPLGNTVFNLVVHHNAWLDTNPLSVPCTLFVDSAAVPHIALTPAGFHVGPTYPAVQTLQICNTGTQDTLQYSIDSVAGGSIVADTASGLLGAGECRNVSLTFDRSGLTLGDNIIPLVVHHNSPLSTNPLSVPCTLFVDSASVPHIALTPASFRIEPTDTNVQTLQICNTGTLDTLQYSISARGSNPNILAWIYGADSTGEYTNTANAIRTLVPLAAITTTRTTDPAALSSLLAGQSVFLIPEQEVTSPSSTIGTAFAPVLDTFVRNGGTVIALSPNRVVTFLSYAGLDTLSYYSTITSGTVTVLNASHPVFDSVPTASITMENATAYWTGSATATRLATYSSYAVCTERLKGSGAIYLLGPDFYTANTTTWGRMLANCVLRGGSRYVTADTATGSVAAGECRNVSLTFDRSGLMPGNTVFQFTISHNSPLSPDPLAVPCTLVVDSASVPHIALTPASFHVGPTYPAVQTLQICNTGTRDTLQYSIDSVAGGRITVDTASGLLGAGECRNVQLTFDRSGLLPGNTIIQLVVRHNGPLEPNPASVPCTLYVDSASVPHIALTPGSYRIEPTDTNVQTLQICNTGTEDSLIFSIDSVAGGRVIADNTAGRLAAGACTNITLTFDRTGLAPGTTVLPLVVHHNGPLEPDPISVPCTLVVDSTTMACSIPGMAVTLYTGDTAMRYVTLQNTGSSILMDTVIKISQEPGAVLINEVCNVIDYIELLNIGNMDVDIGGWRLVWTDNTSTSGSYTIPAGTIVRARRCVLFTEGAGTGSDSVIYMGNSIGWGTTTQLSVSLLDGSGTGVDFFKTSGDATLPPAGTSWSGAGVTAGNQSYYRDTIIDNNTAADWVISSSYTYCLPNPGQTFGSVMSGYITAAQDSFYLDPGQSILIPFTYDASLLYTSGFYIDTFNIIQNSSNVPSPITVICTLTVISNIPELIPYTPDPTVNRRPTLMWHAVASASMYTVEASLTPAFSTLEIMQQTTDTAFSTLADLPLGMIYWRVRSDLNTRYSPPDNFFIQSDSVPLLIPLVPDTMGQRPNTLFSWHPSTGAASYRIRVYDITSGTPTAVILTDVADTAYVYSLTLPVAKYMWTVSSSVDTSRTAYPDTFWVDASPVFPGGNQKLLPSAFALMVHATAGHLKISCAVPRQPAAGCAAVTIDLFDIRGRLIRVLYSGVLPAGYHRLPVTAGALANGVYYCRMRAGSYNKVAPLHFMR